MSLPLLVGQPSTTQSSFLLDLASRESSSPIHRGKRAISKHVDSGEN